MADRRITSEFWKAINKWQKNGDLSYSLSPIQKFGHPGIWVIRTNNNQIAHKINKIVNDNEFGFKVVVGKCNESLCHVLLNLR